MNFPPAAPLDDARVQLRTVSSSNHRVFPHHTWHALSHTFVINVTVDFITTTRIR